MDMKVGQCVQIRSTGYKGVITSIRIGAKATDGMILYHDRARTSLPDYIEIDGYIQVHPSRVRSVRCGGN